MKHSVNRPIVNNGLVVVVLGQDALPRAAEIWKLLERDCTDCTLTARWNWIVTWLQHFGSLVEYWFLVGMRKKTPVGILLLTKETRRKLPLPVKSYHFGTNGEPYQDQVRMINNMILARAGEKKAFIASALDTVFKLFAVEELVFDEFRREDAGMVVEALRNYRCRVRIKEEPTLYLDLDAIRKQGGTVEERFGRYMRRSIKRAMSAFDDALVCTWAKNQEEASEILSELIGFYQTTWRRLGKRGMFTSPYFRDFQMDIIRKLIKSRKVILFRVRSFKFGTVGCLYMFIDGRTAYSYQIGVNDFSHVDLHHLSSNRIKTGYIVHTQCMKECLRRGIGAYNFLTGIYPYKQQMTDNCSSVVTVSATTGIKPIVRNTILDMYTKLEQRRKSLKILSILRTIVTPKTS